VRPKVDKRELL